MKLSGTMQRWTTVALLAAAGLLTIAPAALADHDYGRRYKGGRWGRGAAWREAAPGRVFVHEHNGAVPLVAGLIGGYILGAVTHPQRVERVVVHDYAPPPPQYRYYDPGADEYWDSLDDCGPGYHGRHGRQVIQVIEVRTGRCVRNLHWRGGRWQDEDDEDDD